MRQARQRLRLRPCDLCSTAACALRSVGKPRLPVERRAALAGPEPAKGSGWVGLTTTSACTYGIACGYRHPTYARPSQSATDERAVERRARALTGGTTERADGQTGGNWRTGVADRRTGDGRPARSSGCAVQQSPVCSHRFARPVSPLLSVRPSAGLTRRLRLASRAGGVGAPPRSAPASPTRAPRRRRGARTSRP